MRQDPGTSSPPEKVVLSRFATFLGQRRKHITQCWIDAVPRNPDIGSADHLDHQELADHLPKLFENLTGSLDGGNTAENGAHDDAERHGRHRWRQDYSLGEVLQELGIVRHMVLVHGLDAFEDAEPDTPKPGLRRVREYILRFFDATATASVEQFVEEQHKQLQVLNERSQAAGDSLKSVNARLHEVDNSRLQLLRTVSHELRNTLNALNGAVMVLGLDGIAEPERQKMFMICHRNFADLSQLLRELTDYSVLLDGQMKVEIEPFNAALLCDELTASFRPLAEVQRVAFDAYAHPGLGEIRSDRLRVKQVLANLISNAIKYRKPGFGSQGAIKMSFAPSTDAARWEITVEDDGSGIAPDHLDTIFEEFQRVAAKSTEAQGVGLGLAITKRLVGLLGGDIRVSSELGEGTCFTVSLPR